MNLLQDELTYRVIGAYLSVYNQLPHQLSESLYQNAFAVALTRRKLAFQREVAHAVYYEGVRVGLYRADVIVEDKVLVELKSAERLSKTRIKQVQTYLRITGMQIGLLFNFSPDVEFKRIYADPAK